MSTMKQFVTDLISNIGFDDYKLDIDEEHRHGSLFVHNQPPVFEEHLAEIVDAFNHIIQAVAQKRDTQAFVLDVNNYRKEREKLITELARAAARKVTTTKEPVSLPAMNSYERRLIHVELATHPEVKTESEGAGKNRYVTIRVIGDEPRPAEGRGEGESEPRPETTD